MIDVGFKIDFRKSYAGERIFSHKHIKQGEVAMVVLELERFKRELLNMEFGNPEMEIEEDDT